MRNEEELRAALASLERHAPDTQAVLTAVLSRAAARQTVRRHRRFLSLVGGGSLAATAAGVAVAMVVSTTATGPAVVPDARLLGALTYDGPPASPADSAAVLRQLATRAAAQPTPALGPVIYMKAASWGIELGTVHVGLNYRSHSFEIGQSWQGSGGEDWIRTNPFARIPAHRVQTGGDRYDQKLYPGWAWNAPATLPSGQAALRRHLLSTPGGRNGKPMITAVESDGTVVVLPVDHADQNPPIPIQMVIFGGAVQLMQNGPLRPAVRASLLRLMAVAVQRPPKHTSFIDLGTVTDRAGHRGIAIAQASSGVVQGGVGKVKWKFIPTRSVWLNIYIFDPANGALVGLEYARCNSPVSNTEAANQRCTALSYAQFLTIKAVPTLPPLRSLRGAR